ncbi:MAG: hypothetical protein WAL61_09445, partial [Acidimicrobiales bacterium]
MTALVLAGPSGHAEHDTGPRHPERAARLGAVMDGVRALGPNQEIVAAAFDEAPMDALERVHDPH